MSSRKPPVFPTHMLYFFLLYIVSLSIKEDIFRRPMINWTKLHKCFFCDKEFHSFQHRKERVQSLELKTAMIHMFFISVYTLLTTSVCCQHLFWQLGWLLSLKTCVLQYFHYPLSFWSRNNQQAVTWGFGRFPSYNIFFLITAIELPTTSAPS